jgi:hypothetical protein
MPRNGISREQVVKAAERLQAHGQSVTVTAVRALLGETGSYTTISGHLKTWRDQQAGAATAVPKELERSLLEFLGRFWRALLAGIGAEVQRRTEGRVGELESEVRCCEDDLRRLRATSERDVAALQAELAENERLLATMEDEVATLQREQRSLLEKEEAIARRLDAIIGERQPGP